jgi:hypothetical protein
MNWSSVQAQQVLKPWLLVKLDIGIVHFTKLHTIGQMQQAKTPFIGALSAQTFQV